MTSVDVAKHKAFGKHDSKVQKGTSLCDIQSDIVSTGLARTKVLLTHPGEFLRKDFSVKNHNGDTVDLEEIQEPQRWDDG
ncbi:hypothetical protein L6452_18963 [Arctium lappa]|uniref:Uncharacterized protein n=1 Tax=Arctium lappa TaxID=4217 RepID=A0ACB9B8H3_ARCLA|nr:hypothetical protein L6452_18963 [Arctium lappa]